MIRLNLWKFLAISAVLLFVAPLRGLAQPAGGGRGPATRPQFQVAKIPIDSKLPTLWLIGDSTVRNGSWDDGRNGQWGWGNPIRHYFDETKINVQNRAVGGTRSWDFQDKQWPWILEELKQGDYLILQFGHNDSGTPPGNSDDLKEVNSRGQLQSLHTYGWYLRKYVTDARKHGVVATVICSPIPRNRWTGETIAPDKWVADCKEAAAISGAKFVNLNDLIIKKYEQLGQQKVTDELFPETEAVHTDWAGAIVNAEMVIEGLKGIDSPLIKYLLPDPPKELKNPSGRAR